MLWPLDMKVCVKNKRRNGSISSFINERGSFANTRSPARKKNNSKKPDTYQPTMSDWIDMYQKFKDEKEGNMPNLNPSHFLRSNGSGPKLSIKQSMKNRFIRKFPHSD